MPRVPFNRADLAGNEMLYIKTAFDHMHVSGCGEFTEKSEDLIAQLLRTRPLLTTSCTHALEMAALLLELQQGDEVIIPSFTFVSTANAFVLRGAKPVFCDIRPDTLNLDESKLEALITPRTKAIIPVHYAGVGCEMDVIMAIADRHNVAVIEDNAHGLFGKYKGRWLGTFGAMATQSFHETKNITCGEGGALLINEPHYEERAEIMREKGTNRARFFRGQVDKYSWVDVGSSYVMSDVLAAFLYGQLEQWQNIQGKRQALWDRYEEALGDWAMANHIKTPVIPRHCDQAYHMYYLIMPSLKARTDFIAKLKDQGITAVFHYLPLHLSSFAKTSGLGSWDTGRRAECPVTESVSDRLVRLPFYASMIGHKQNCVINACLKWHA